jgi:phosphopantetheinyl transferase
MTAAANRPAPGRAAVSASGPVQPQRVDTQLDVSLAAMPYLIDHCFYKQRPGWPDDEDRWPVVPATTLIAHMMGFAESAAPGATAVAARDVRFEKWVAAIPSTTIPASVVPDPAAASTVAVALAGHSRARIELARAYPASSSTLWRFAPGSERKPELLASELYSKRWMFHGPLFQGVTELTAVGDMHVRGVITTPAAPGALLDNVGQVLGYWVMSTLPERTTVFPVGMDEVRFFGPHPDAGTPVECLVRVTEVTEADLRADVQLVVGGQLWAEITGWRDRRFDSNAVTQASDREPEFKTLSTLHPEGWAEVTEMWPDLATRELLMRKVLGREERAQYAQVSPRRRRQWLLGRVAVKDAVRQHLWRSDPGGIFLHELLVGNASNGAPFVRGRHSRVVPDLTVSLAHCQEIGVGITRLGPCGIDVEEVLERDETTVRTALSENEQHLLRGLAADPADAPLWFTAMWTAKEAVAKSLGTGLQGAPKHFVVVRAEPLADRRARLTVEAVGYGGAAFTVHTRTTSNPAPLPRRMYVVAWTGPEDREMP